MGVAFGEGERGSGIVETDDQVDRVAENVGVGKKGRRVGQEKEKRVEDRKMKREAARYGVRGAVDEWMERTAKRMRRVRLGSGFGSGGSRPRRDCIFPLWECRNAG